MMSRYVIAVKEEWIQHLEVEAESAEQAIALVNDGEGDDAGYSEALSQEVIGLIEEGE